MEYGNALAQPPPLTANQRRLQLRRALSTRTGSNLSVRKVRHRSTSGSSRGSNVSSTFDSYAPYSMFGGELSKPSTPLDDVSHEPGSMEMSRRISGKGLRKSSFFSDSSTLADTSAFGDILGLEKSSLIGPRFADSGSGGEGTDLKRERDSTIGSIMRNGTDTIRRRPSGKRRHSISSDEGYTTPPPKNAFFRGSASSTPGGGYMDMHPEDAARYIEHLEAQTHDLTSQLHNLTSPNSSSSNVAKLKKLTAENRALKNEIEEWEMAFEEKVKNESRSKIIANEMETRSKIKDMEQVLESTRAKINDMEAMITRLKEALQECDTERQQAEMGKYEAERKVEMLTDILREKEEEERNHNHSRPTSRGARSSRYAGTQFTESVMSAPQRKGRQSPRPMSISSSQFEHTSDEEEEEDEEEDQDDTQSTLSQAVMGLDLFRPGPHSERNFSGKDGGRRKRVRGSSPHAADSNTPKVIVPRPSSPSHSAVMSPTSMFGNSRPHSALSHNRPIYTAGNFANASQMSIDSGVTSPVQSTVSSAPVNVGNSLFAELELSRFDEDDMSMSEAISHRDDVSEVSRAHSRAPSYASLYGGNNYRPPSIAVSNTHTTFSVTVPTNTIPTTITHANLVNYQLPPPRISIFSAFTNSSSGPLHLVADAMTRYTLGKTLIAIGHGLKSPRVTLCKVRNKARDVIERVLTAGHTTGVDRVSRKRRRLYSSQQGRENRGLWAPSTASINRDCNHCRKRTGRSNVGGRRSASAPISSRVSGVHLTVGTPRTQSPVRFLNEKVQADNNTNNNNAATHSHHHHHHPHSALTTGNKGRRVSTASRRTITPSQHNDHHHERVRRQHQVHAGDNVWMWFRFFMAIVVTLGVAVKGDGGDSDDDDLGIVDEQAIDSDDTDDSDDNYSDEDDEYEDDEEMSDVSVDETPELKVEKWRRSTGIFAV